jgi:hypothetical protein
MDALRSQVERLLRMTSYAARRVLDRRPIPVKRCGVAPRPARVKGRLRAFLADNDNGGAVAVRFGIAGAAPLEGQYRQFTWIVGATDDGGYMAQSPAGRG